MTYVGVNSLNFPSTKDGSQSVEALSAKDKGRRLWLLRNAHMCKST